MSRDDQYEKDKASARAYVKKQHKKLEESGSSWDPQAAERHYQDKIKRVSKDYERKFDEGAPASSGGGCTLS